MSLGARAPGHARIRAEAFPGGFRRRRHPAISERVVRLYLDAFGHGPSRVRTYVQPQFAVCVLRGVLTTGERWLLDVGNGAEVEAARATINEAIDRRYVSIVETQTGRSVLSHPVRTRVPVDLAVHFFLFDVPAGRDGVAG
jgi:uncharacterized protein YbcI